MLDSSCATPKQELMQVHICVLCISPFVSEDNIFSELFVDTFPQGLNTLFQCPWVFGDPRNVEWFGLKGTFKFISFQLPCHDQEQPSLDQAAQSPVQPDFEHF